MNVIYALSHPITGEVRYVGKAKNPDTRLCRHINNCAKDKTHSARWINSLFRNNIIPNLNILEVIKDNKEWQEREIFWIATLRKAGCALTNITDGGEGNKGGKASRETRLKMSLSHLGKSPSQKHRAAISAALKGKKWTLEQKLKMSNIKTGTVLGPPSMEHREKISKALTGIKRSSEVVLEMKARRASPKTIEKLRISHLGKKQSPETRAKITSSLKNYWAVKNG